MAEIRNLQRPGRAAQKRRGFALLFVLAFAAVVIVFTATIGSEATFNMRLASTRGQTDRAYYAANTGTQLILSLLREPPFIDLNNDGEMDGETESWLGTDATMRADLNRSNSQTYAKVYHNIRGFPHASPDIPNSETKIAADNFFILSVGVVNAQYEDGELVGGMRYEQATMGATLTPQFPLLPHAAFSSGPMSINGRVDHFDSRTMPFAPATNSNRPEASVATKLTTASEMQISATAKIIGNVFLGKGAPSTELDALANSIPDSANPATKPLVVNPPGTGDEAPQYGVSGARMVSPAGGRDAAIVAGKIDSLPTEKDPYERQETQYHGTLDATSGDLLLDEGKTYLYSGSLEVTNSRKVSIKDVNGDGKFEDAVLVVEGDISFTNSNNNVNGNAPPQRLKIFSLNGTSFKMQNSRAYCLVAGNDLKVEIGGNSELWGAVAGNDVSLDSTSQIHYDVALRDPNIVAGVYGFRIGNSTIVSGASYSLAQLTSPVGIADPTTGAAATGTSGVGTGTSGTGTVGTGGCGCGCGCGSMLMAQEQKV